jgi:large subunit ribosomal protein L15
MSLHEINEGVHKNKKPNRKGRGIGHGQGKTAGRGHKGQRARAGFKQLPIFQGGGSPLVRRIPKRGFTNSYALTVAEINVGDLEELFEAGASITPDSLQEAGILKRRFDLLKVLGDGELTKKLSVSAHRFSASARDKIEKAGGSVTVVPGRKSVAEKTGRKKKGGKKSPAESAKAEASTAP